MNWFFDLFFPHRCWHCKKVMPTDSIFCCECETLIPFYESIHQTEGDFHDALKLKFPFEGLYVLMKFEKKALSQQLIHQLKYNKLEFFAKILAKYTIERLSFGEDTSKKPDVITYVPLHAKKQKSRGFNQNHLFATLLSEYYDIPLEPHLLKRTKNNKAQASKNRENRLKSENDFELDKMVNYKHVLLIDDVCTTGKTLENCAWKLLKTQGILISILIVAKD